MLFDVDVTAICRDDLCIIPGIHQRHEISPSLARQLRKRESKGCQRPTKRSVWKLDDVDGLREAVERATSRYYPTHLQLIHQTVLHDYGSCCERTVYRHLRWCVDTGRVIKLDLGLSFAGYLRAGSPLVNEPDTLREQMLDWCGQGHQRTRIEQLF